MAKMLIEQLSTPFEPGKYKDDYREKVLTMIEQKVAGEEIKVAPEAQKTNVIDLMAALQASLEAVKPASVPTEPAEPAAAPKAKGKKKAKETVS